LTAFLLALLLLFAPFSHAVKNNGTLWAWGLE
jgi:hypothetical protein